MTFGTNGFCFKCPAFCYQISPCLTVARVSGFRQWTSEEFAGSLVESQPALTAGILMRQTGRHCVCKHELLPCFLGSSASPTIFLFCIFLNCKICIIACPPSGGSGNTSLISFLGSSVVASSSLLSREDPGLLASALTDVLRTDRSRLNHALLLSFEAVLRRTLDHCPCVSPEGEVQRVSMLILSCVPSPVSPSSPPTLPALMFFLFWAGVTGDALWEVPIWKHHRYTALLCPLFPTPFN